MKASLSFQGDLRLVSLCLPITCGLLLEMTDGAASGGVTNEDVLEQFRWVELHLHTLA